MKYTFPLVAVALVTALTTTAEVNAYDPAPDPRLAPRPAAPGPTANSARSRDTYSSGGNAPLSARSSQRGQPGFGSADRYKLGDGGYGGGYNRGGR